MQNPKFFGLIYIPEYAKDYHSLPWYEKYLMRYFSYLDYKDMADNPDYYFDDKKVVNFEIIHHQCRGNPLKKTEKEHKTICADDFKNCPENEKSKTLYAVFRNKRNDLWVKRNLIIGYFKKFF